MTDPTVGPLHVAGEFAAHNGKIMVWRDDFDLATAAKIHKAGAA